jgi:hypothetical protein
MVDVDENAGQPGHQNATAEPRIQNSRAGRGKQHMITHSH